MSTQPGSTAAPEVRWPAFELRCPLGHLIIGGMNPSFVATSRTLQEYAERYVKLMVGLGRMKPWCSICGSPRDLWQPRQITLTKLEAAQKICEQSRIKLVLQSARLDFDSYRHLATKALAAGNPGDQQPAPLPVYPAIEVRCSNSHLLKIEWRPGFPVTIDTLSAVAYHWAQSLGEDKRCPACGDQVCYWRLLPEHLDLIEARRRIDHEVWRCHRLADAGLTWLQWGRRPKQLPRGDVLTTWAIYQRPDDFPNHFVVRAHYVLPRNPFPVPGPAGSEYVCASLEEARRRIPPGLVPIAAHPELDVKCLMETWV